LLAVMFWCCYNAPETVADEPDVVDSVPLTSSTEVGRLQRSLTEGLREDGVRIEEPTSIPEVLEPAANVAPAKQGEEEDAMADAAGQESDNEEFMESADDPFNVILEMTPGERLGAMLDVLDMKTLRVVQVRAQGRLSAHNLRATVDKQVQAGQYIVSVNGKSGKSEELVEEMRRSRTWRLRFAQKKEITVSIEKSGPLCLDLQFEKESDCIVIRKIGDGVVKEFNQRVEDEEQQVKVGDRITDVNGAGGTAREMLRAIRENTTLDLTIARPLLKPEQKLFLEATNRAAASQAAAAAGGA